mmetsp:Transcript_111008/g.313017  ORF Transcript_111008/g.313017 Transcript_111008/m.313017 type:complete len:301 (+) Transcript_111008:272-1174(+)
MSARCSASPPGHSQKPTRATRSKRRDKTSCFSRPSGNNLRSACGMRSGPSTSMATRSRVPSARSAVATMSAWKPSTYSPARSEMPPSAALGLHARRASRSKPCGGLASSLAGDASAVAITARCFSTSSAPKDGQAARHAAQAAASRTVSRGPAALGSASSKSPARRKSAEVVSSPGPPKPESAKASRASAADFADNVGAASRNAERKRAKEACFSSAPRWQNDENSRSNAEADTWSPASILFETAWANRSRRTSSSRRKCACATATAVAARMLRSCLSSSTSTICLKARRTCRPLPVVAK